MSRHEIKPKNQAHTCTVGYDRGMKTFFAQVQDSTVERLADEAAARLADACDRGVKPDPADVRASERSSTIFWIGADSVGQIPTVELLAEQLSPYAELDAETVETLRRDQREAESTPRTRHQINALDYLLRSRKARTAGRTTNAGR